MHASHASYRMIQARHWASGQGVVFWCIMTTDWGNDCSLAMCEGITWPGADSFSIPRKKKCLVIFKSIFFFVQCNALILKISRSFCSGLDEIRYTCHKTSWCSKTEAYGQVHPNSLGLASGAWPFMNHGTTYSCWPVGRKVNMQKSHSVYRGGQG